MSRINSGRTIVALLVLIVLSVCLALAIPFPFAPPIETATPTLAPSQTTTHTTQTLTPVVEPSGTPTLTATATLTATHTDTPTNTPTLSPTREPTNVPTNQPTVTPPPSLTPIAEIPKTGAPGSGFGGLFLLITIAMLLLCGGIVLIRRSYDMRVKGVMMKGLLILLLAMLLASFSPTPSVLAGGCEDVSCASAEYVAQEPYLYCVARDTGIDVGILAVAKLEYDHSFGVSHNLSGDEWGASYGQRVQGFTDLLGTPNPTNSDGKPNAACQRLIDAHFSLLALFHP